MTTWNTKWRNQWLLQSENEIVKNKIKYNINNVGIRCKIADNIKREVGRPVSRQKDQF